MKTKFAIGCLVQWYEVDIIEEYIDSLRDAIDYYGGKVKINFTIVTNQDLEKIQDKVSMLDIQEKIQEHITMVEWGCHEKCNVFLTKQIAASQHWFQKDLKKLKRQDYLRVLELLLKARK